MRKFLQWTISLSISALALWLAFKDVRPAEVWEALTSANYLFVMVTVLAIYIGLHARALSWRTILGPIIPYWRVFDALNEGYLLNNVLPFRLGEVGRAYLISHGQKITAPQALSSVLVERVIDLCMIIGMLGAFLPLIAGQTWTRQAAWVSLVFTSAALGGLFFIARQRDLVLRLVRWGLGRIPGLDTGPWEERAHAFIDGMAALQDARRFASAAFWSAMAWVCAGVGSSALLFAFNLPGVDSGNFLHWGFFVLVISGLGVALPSAPASAGVFELAVMAALSVFNIDGAPALSYALMFHAINFSLTCALGAWGLAREGESLSHLAQAAQNLLSTARPTPPIAPPPLSE